MKKVLLLAVSCLLLFGVSHAQENLPAYSGFVNDYAGILDAQSSNKIVSLVKELEKKTSAELAIAVVKTTAPLVPKEYAVKLFEKWKIGKKGKDNGVLILLAMEERRVEVEVGYGLEGVLNDAKTGQILDAYVVPFFKKGDFAGGIYNGAEAIAAEIAKEAKTELAAGYQGYKGTAVGVSEGDDSLIVNILVFAIIAFIVFMAVAHPLVVGGIGAIIGGSIGVMASGMGSALFGGIIGYVVSALFAWIMGKLAKNYKGGSGGTSSGGGWFSGGSSSSDGGGFSFGGGRSGGGGAGRSW